MALRFCQHFKPFKTIYQERLCCFLSTRSSSIQYPSVEADNISVDKPTSTQEKSEFFDAYATWYENSFTDVKNQSLSNRSPCKNLSKQTTFSYNGPTEVSLSSVIAGFGHHRGLSNASNILNQVSDSATPSLNPYSSIGNRLYSTTKSGQEAAPDNQSNEKPDDKVESTQQKLKKILAQYGAFGMTVHITLSLGFLGLTYLAVYSGVDVQSIFLKFGVTMSSLTSGTSTFLIAYAAHKMLFPVRASVSIITVPVLVRHLRKIGYFKK